MSTHEENTAIVNSIEQPFTSYTAPKRTHHILFNKGKYFETSIYDRALLVSLSKAAKIKIEFNYMLVGTAEELVRLVKAFNKRGHYVQIKQDWI